MVRGKIWGEFNGRYHEIEIEECDVIAVIGLKNKGDMIGSQVSSLGGGLATEDCALSVADGVDRVIQAVEVYPEEKKLVQRIVIEEMERAYTMQVPLQADYGWGSNWLEAH